MKWIEEIVLNSKCEFCGTEDKLPNKDLCDGCHMHLYMEEVRHDLEQEWHDILLREDDQYA